MFGLGTQELLLILLLVLILFGAKKIPDIMRGLGQGIREFKQASQEAVDEVKALTEDSPDDSNSGDSPIVG